ncbi:MAG: biotin--[acetyl-CoA-carboxylase] ligase [Candidatus Saccharicenans sp.]|nr:biotin--[acetyl-CoA-carboxylase] ligase [Candidatus Saccharicenans sp.]
MEAINFGELSFRFASLSSTMDFGRTLARLGFPEGTAVLADEQSAGRGTRGRHWHSPAKKGLYVSFLLRPPVAFLNLVPLTAGLAAAEAIDKLAGVNINLKWPNDLLFKGRKIGGILCESQTTQAGQSYVVAGFGINLNHRQEDFPAGVASLASSLYLASGQNYQPEELFQLLGKELQFWYNKLKEGQADLIIGRLEKKLCFSPGQTLIIQEPAGQVKGQFISLGQDGSLILQTGQENKKYYASEIIKVMDGND